MNRLFCIATAAAALVAGGANAQPYGYGGGYGGGYTGGYLPAPAYAYAGYGQETGGGYEQGGSQDCDGFTLLGAHAGVTVLGVNAGIGARLGVGDEACRGGGRPVQYAPAAPPPQQPEYAPQFPPPQYAQPYPQQNYGPQGPCCMAPPPPPCGCQSAYGW